jgi:hypothetical protein
VAPQPWELEPVTSIRVEVIAAGGELAALAELAADLRSVLEEGQPLAPDTPGDELYVGSVPAAYEEEVAEMEAPPPPPSPLPFPTPPTALHCVGLAR